MKSVFVGLWPSRMLTCNIWEFELLTMNRRRQEPICRQSCKNLQETNKLRNSESLPEQTEKQATCFYFALRRSQLATHRHDDTSSVYLSKNGESQVELSAPVPCSAESAPFSSSDHSLPSALSCCVSFPVGYLYGASGWQIIVY
jgi:hypothetical protein